MNREPLSTEMVESMLAPSPRPPADLRGRIAASLHRTPRAPQRQLVLCLIAAAALVLATVVGVRLASKPASIAPRVQQLEPVIVSMPVEAIWGLAPVEAVDIRRWSPR